MNNILALRKLIGFSRKAMQTKYGISASSLERWEKGAKPNKNSCNKLITAANAAGIQCNYDWLIYGIGAPVITKADTMIPDEVIRIYKAMPKKNNLSIYMMPDESMLPKVHKGDWIIAELVSLNDIEALNNQVCLISTHQEKLVRVLKCRNSYDKYDLLTINYVEQCPNIYNSKIVTVSKILYLFYA